MSEEEKRPEEESPRPEEMQKNEPPKEPVRYATRGQRIAAWIAAIGVIIVTLAYVYALSTGALIKA
jgi:hypothetical protein